MPRHADHDQRRRQIARALLRIAGTRGLHTAGMREVAAEAGVSVRLIQYYFGTKEQLLLFTVRYLGEQLSERVRARVRMAADPPTPRTVIEALLTEALPTDEDSRIFNVVYTSYAALSLTDPTLSIQPLLQGSDAAEAVIADQFAAAQRAGQMAPGLDPRAEATIIMTLSAGLGTSVLHAQRTPGDALAVIRYHLDRLLAPRDG